AVIVARTRALLERLELGAIELPWQVEMMRQAMREERFLLGGEHLEPVGSSTASALLGLSEAGDLWSAETSAVAIPGLVSDRVVEELLTWPLDSEPTILVPD